MHDATHPGLRVASDRTTVRDSTAGPHDPPARRLLGIWAHPDDEAYLSAGLMDRVVRAGGEITILALSDGEGGFPGDDPRSADAKRRQRRAELRTAMAAIGVDDVRFLGLADGAVADADADAVVAAILGAIHGIDPDLVVTFGPDGITGHTDHVACWALATRAWWELGRADLWYAAKTTDWLDEWRELHERLSIWMTEEPTGVAPDHVEHVVRLDGADLLRKRAVLRSHHSQTTGVADAMGEATYRRWIREEAFRSPTVAEVRAAIASHASPRSLVRNASKPRRAEQVAS